MSLARAFTTRRAKHSVDLKEGSGLGVHRSNTTSKGSISIRNKISGPMELTHTTNMLAFNAPDLHPRSAASSTTSPRISEDESDVRTSSSTPPTSPDTASVDGPFASVAPNYLSSYFMAPGQKLPTAVDAPQIPHRSPSHTKQASIDKIAQNYQTRSSNQSGHSLSSKTSFSESRPSSGATAATSMSSNSYHRTASKPSVPVIEEPAAETAPPTTPATPASPPILGRSMSRSRREQTGSRQPFGKELAEVSKVAESFGVRDKIIDFAEEEAVLKAKGLCKFRADDYLTEVQSLFSDFFRPEPRHPTGQHHIRQPEPMWI